MSYILEALKKAQAERQLGNAPTIHAPALHASPPAAGGRKPLAIAFAAGGAVLVAAALFAWRQQPAAPEKVAEAGRAGLQAAPASPAISAAPAAASQAAPVAAASSQPVAATPSQPVAAASSQPVGAPTPAAGASAAAKAESAESTSGALVALVPDPAGSAGAGAAKHPRVQPAPQKPTAPALARSAPSPAVAGPKPAAHDAAPVPVIAAQADSAPPPVAPGDDTLRTLNELPESIRFNVPKVAFGGYMYSPNPADRLVLVDRVLRHEGEEVAPGLVLERLLPKAAVMNFRGYRYRVPL